MRRALIYLFWCGLSCRIFALPAYFESADLKYRAEIIDRPLRGADLDLEPLTLRLSRNGVVIAQHPTLGYLLSAEWSPDGKFVAINNRRMNSGDYLWIFTLPEGRCLKAAGDKFGRLWQAAAVGAAREKDVRATEQTLNQLWLTAEGWNGERLLIGIRARYSVGIYDCDGVVKIETPKLILQDLQVTPAQPASTAR